MAGSNTLLQTSNALWAALSNMRIEQGGARRFEDALAAETGWPPLYAERVADEYRRFLYLAATAPFEVTPSQAVDEAWHLHLAYRSHYSDVLCLRILKRPLHHLPGTGDPADEERLAQQYRETRALYEQSFGAPPPPDIWPDPDRAEEPVPDDEAGDGLWSPSRAVVHQRLFCGGIAALAASAFAAMAGGPVLAIVLGIAASTLLLFLMPYEEPIRQRAHGACGGGCGGYLDTGDSSGGGASCGGGCGGGD